MTDLEKFAFSILLEVREHFAPGRPVARWTYQEVMGHVRDGIRRMESREAGCPTGLHMCECTCKAAVPGKAKYHGHTA